MGIYAIALQTLALAAPAIGDDLSLCELGHLSVPGARVAIDGDYAVVGAGETSDKSGIVHILKRTGTTWSVEQILQAPEPEILDTFGMRVAIDGDIIAIAAAQYPVGIQSGAVFIYQHRGDVWEFETILTAPDGSDGDVFGLGLDLNGDLLIAGSPADDIDGPFQQNRGSAHIFRRADGVWNHETMLLHPKAEDGDAFGFDTAVTSEFVAVGSLGDDDVDSNAGSVCLFEYTDENEWKFHSILVASDGDDDDAFGLQITLRGDLLAVSAPEHDSQNGAVYVYSFIDGEWRFHQKLMAANPEGPFPFFGTAIAFNDSLDAMIIGAFEDYTAGPGSGAAHLFVLQNEKWIETNKFTPAGFGSGTMFGRSAAISGSSVLIGASDIGSFAFEGMDLQDCNGNRVSDSCDILFGESVDRDSDSVPDECATTCDGDLDDDSSVTFHDLLLLLDSWGDCDFGVSCPADLDRSGSVAFDDLIILLNSWGRCVLK